MPRKAFPFISEVPPSPPWLRIALGVVALLGVVVAIIYNEKLFEMSASYSPRWGSGVGGPLLGCMFMAVFGWGLLYYGLKDLRKRKKK